MKKQVEEIIKNKTNSDFGFCSFSLVLDNLISCRAKDRLPQNAKTIILFTFPYKVKDEKPKNISRYAAVPDYHEVCGKQLSNITNALRAEYPHYNFEYFIDNSPIPEVFAASAAGLGVYGENGLLITEKYGSFVFIGEIVTDLPIETVSHKENCLGCGACAAACPVSLNKAECLSLITQQKKDLSPEQALLIKENSCVWGCDICQEICPMNKGKEKTENPEFIRGYRDSYTPGEDIAGRAYAWRGEKVINRNCFL